MINYSKICYCGMNIKDYCDKYNIDFKYIKYKLRFYRKNKEKFLPLEIQLQLSILSYDKRRKYINLTYRGLRLLDYCKSNNIEYRRIAYRCYYFVNKGNDFSLINEEQIGLFIEKYKYREEVKKLRNTFVELDDSSDVDYELICKNLNINYNKLKCLLKYDVDFKTLIYISWYSSDMCDENGIYVSKRKLDKILSNEDLELNDLCAMYKSGFSEYLEKIFEYEKYYLIGFVLRVIKEYDFRVYVSNYEDLFSEARIILTRCVTLNVFNDIRRIIRYIEKSVTGQIFTYLVKNYSSKVYQFDDNIKIKSHLVK